VASEADANHGLVHYYFGSMENLLARVLERFTERLIARQRAMYAADDIPFIEKWRAAMRYLDADRSYQKVWYELQALAWSRPELRERVARVNAEWRAVLSEALAEPHERYGMEMPLDALVSLVITPANPNAILNSVEGDIVDPETGRRAAIVVGYTLWDAEDKSKLNELGAFAAALAGFEDQEYTVVIPVADDGKPVWPCRADMTSDP
jgi:AcrR family transcriptional regulator